MLFLPRKQGVQIQVRKSMETENEQKKNDPWSNVSDPQPHPFAPFGQMSDGDTVIVEIVDGPWGPPKYSEHAEIDMHVQQVETGQDFILAPGKTLAARLRDMVPPPTRGDRIRIEQQGDGYEKDWNVERVN